MRAPTSVETSVHRKLTAASGIVQVEPPAKCSGRRGDVARISISALRRYVICRNLTDTPEASASPTPAAGKLVNIDKLVASADKRGTNSIAQRVPSPRWLLKMRVRCFPTNSQVFTDLRWIEC